MEELKDKVFHDDLNKSEESDKEIGKSPRKYVSVPKIKKDKKNQKDEK